MLNKCFSKLAKPVKSLHNFFEYGALKRGEPSYKFLKNKKNGYAKFLFLGKTVNKYPLMVLTGSNLPCMIRRKGIGYNVEGEVYEIDDKMLQSIDIFQGHPNIYSRYPELIRNDAPNKSEIVLSRCWTYFFVLDNTEPVVGHLLKNYDSKGKHGRPFGGGKKF